MREPEPHTVGRARAGDLHAFEWIVREYQGDVWRFAYHLTGNRTVAEDVTQEAFLRAFRGLSTFRGQAKFSSWLLRIVRNCAIDAYRKNAREISSPVQEHLEREPASGPSWEDRLRIQDAIRRLPLPLREPFVLIEVLGFNYHETSSILHVKVGTVKSRMHRARTALMQSLSSPEVAGEV